MTPVRIMVARPYRSSRMDWSPWVYSKICSSSFQTSWRSTVPRLGSMARLWKPMVIMNTM